MLKLTLPGPRAAGEPREIHEGEMIRRTGPRAPRVRRGSRVSKPEANQRDSGATPRAAEAPSCLAELGNYQWKWK